MMKTIKKAAKIGAGVLVFTAVASAMAGYVLGKRNRYYDIEDIEDDYEMDRDQAFKDIVQAGRAMKTAWKRIQRDAKIIAKKTVTNEDGETDEEEDDDEE